MSALVSESEIKGEVHIPTVGVNGNAISTAIPGTVTKQIGSGEHALNSIVYRTILWSFIAGGALSGAVVAIAMMRESNNPFADVKDVWSIFAPMITLALGYLFGKAK